MGVWDELKQRLEVRYASEGKVKKSTPQYLDQFERQSGFKLPDDYREFAATFGPGTIGQGWEITAPGFEMAKQGGLDLGKLNGRLQAVFPGLVLIGGKEDFHGWFAWDPQDVTDPVSHDYGVYQLGGPNGEESEALPMKVASSFRQFVLAYALGGGFERLRAEHGYGKPGEANVSGPVGFIQVV